MVKLSGSEGSEKDKKNGGMPTKDYGLAFKSLVLALFTIFSLYWLLQSDAAYT